MQALVRIITIGILLAIYSGAINALEVDYDYFFLSPEFEYLVDSENDLTLNDILTQKLRFTKSGITPVPRLDRFTSLWLKLQLSFDSKAQQDRYYLLSLLNHLDEIDIYRENANDIFSRFSTGNIFPFSERELNEAKYGFTVDPAIAEQTIYLRIKGGMSVNSLSWVLVNDEVFQTESEKFYYLNVFCYTAIIAIFLFNLGFFVVLRRAEYLLYSGFILFGGLTYASIDHIAYQFLWPRQPEFNAISTNLFMLLSAISRLMAFALFLNIKSVSIGLHRSVKLVVTLLALGLLALIILGSACPPWIFIIIWLISLFYTLLMCVYCLYRKVALSGILLFILLVPTIFNVAQMIFYGGIVPVEAQYLFVSQFGFVIHAVLFSLCIAVHLKNETKEKQSAIEASLRAYSHVFQLKTDFLTAISHELRTPMNGIFGSLQLLRADQDINKKSSQLVDSAWISAKDMMRLINDILSFSEIQSGHTAVKNDLFDFEDATSQSRSRYQLLCKAKGINLKWHVDGGMPNQLVGDQEKVRIIISKLLDNAVKFTQQGDVSFSAKVESIENSRVSLVLEVSDNGEGIPANEMLTIYEAFKQRESGLRRSYGGLGIGLSITKGLVDALGGSVEIQSDPNCGTKISVYLTLQYIEDALTPVKITEKPDFDKLDAVLIVEDNRVNQLILEKMVTRLGCQSVLANNGKEALDILEKEPVSAILMDLQMPVMDGLECSRQIKNLPDARRNLPIIAVSGNAMDFNRLDCINAGMVAYIKKPINYSILEQVLFTHLKVK